MFDLRLYFFFFYWRHNPLWVLTFSVIFFHSVLSLLSFLHPLIPIIWISSSKSSIHLFLGLPLILLPIGFHSNILLDILPPSIRITCPSQAILLLFIILTMSALHMSSFSSWFFLILQIQFSSCTGPNIFLNIFRSNILNWFKIIHRPKTQISENQHYSVGLSPRKTLIILVCRCMQMRLSIF